MRARPTVLISSAIAFAVLVAGCSSSGSSAGANTSSSASAGPVNILAIVPLSGPIASLGEAFEDSAKAAITVLNAHGGILGRKVVLTTVDDQGDPTQAVTILQSKLTGSNLPVLVSPGVLGTEEVPMLPLLSADKIISIGPGSAPDENNPSKYPYAFNLGPGATGAETAVVDYLKSKGYTRVAELWTTQDDDGGSAAFQAAAKAAGISVVSATIDNGAVDATSELLKLKTSDPQALVMGQFVGAVNGVILKGVTQLGWNVPVVGDFGPGNQDVAAMVTPAQLTNFVVEATNSSVAGSAAQQTAAFKTFIGALDKYASTKPYTTSTYAAYYSTIMLYAAGVEKAKSFDSDKVKAAIESFGTSAVIPDYMATTNGPGFSASNHSVEVGKNDFQFIKPSTLNPATGSFTVAG